MKWPLGQILVVVANIKMRTLKTKVEEGELHFKVPKHGPFIERELG